MSTVIETIFKKHNEGLHLINDFVLSVEIDVMGS